MKDSKKQVCTVGSEGKFRALKITRNAKITLNARLEEVFPLFGAFEERKWVEGWNPELIYPEKELIQEGTAFLTKGIEIEPEYLWIVTKYEDNNHLIQYLVSTTNRFWTIDVICRSIEENKTEAEIKYSYTSLNKLGNELNKNGLESTFNSNLNNWQSSINNYLKK